MHTAKVYVTYKPSILDPKGEAVKDAVHHLGYTDIESVRIGKYFEIQVNNDDAATVEKMIDDISDTLLANVTMESYRYEIEEVK